MEKILLDRKKLILRRRKLPYHINNSFYQDYEKNPDIYQEFIKISKKNFFNNNKFIYYFIRRIYPSNKKQFAISCADIDYVPKTFTCVSDILNNQNNLPGIWFVKPENSRHFQLSLII